MVKYIIRHNWINYAHIKHTGYPFNETTIVKDGRGQITGTLGEMAFGRWLTDLDIDFEYCADDSMNYDFKVGEYRIDVKTKKTHGVTETGLHGENPEVAGAPAVRYVRFRVRHRP
jgi:hypothetical protein